MTNGGPNRVFTLDILQDPETFFDGIRKDKQLTNIENVTECGVYYNPWSFSFEVWFVHATEDWAECVGGIPLKMTKDNPHYALKKLEDLVYMMLEVSAARGWPGKGIDVER